MNRTEGIITPRYLKIAMDIAARIVSGELKEGVKLKGRSVLSTEYNVSPETIRRSMSILSDKNVVRINAGSGIEIISRKQAIQFVNNFNSDEILSNMKSSLSQLFDKRIELDEEISMLTNQIVDMYKYMRTDLISPVEIILPENSHVIGKSIGNLQIWHNTGATIIGIVQGNYVIISPGPYYEFATNDRVLIVGDNTVIERFNAYVTRYNY